MEIKKLNRQHLPMAISLVKQVFDKYVSPFYKKTGHDAFYAFLGTVLKADNGRDEILWGCFINDILTGVLLLRDNNHISLLFVLPDYFKKGIARALFNTACERAKSCLEPCITVNASPYGFAAYKQLGFCETDAEKEQDGIRYTPMIYYIYGFCLRPFTLEDAINISLCANDYDIAKNLRNVFPHPYTPEDGLAFVKNAQAEKNAIIRCIEIQGEAAGSIGVFPLNDVYEKSAEIGYWLAKPHWGKGIMPKAVDIICGEAFSSLDIVRIHAEVFANNISSVNVLKKAGFVFEGTKRNSVYKNGQILDSVIYSMLKEEYKPGLVKKD